MLARALGASVGASVHRIQFTPDLLPGDVTGVSVYSPGEREFTFKPGAIFANIVIADEINRSSPKTQSALLEAMEEGQVTADGVARAARPFSSSPRRIRWRWKGRTRSRKHSGTVS